MDNEIRFGWAENDWTVMVGLRRAFVSLLWRGVACMIVWMALLCALSSLATAGGWTGFLAEIGAIVCVFGAGVIFGLLVGHRLSNSVGVSGGWPLLIAAWATYWVALGIGTWAAGAYVTISPAAAYFAVGITGVIGSAVIARSLMLSN